MDTRVSYALVGGFVVVFTVVMIAVGLWLAAAVDGAEYRHYSVYTTDSVAGLRRDSPVTYHGVDVGQVERIAIDRRNPQRIHLVLRVETGTPVSDATVATLRTRGITGIGYVDLSGGQREGRAPPTPAGEPYPVIDYETSLLGRLDTVAVDMLDALSGLTEQIGALLSEDNRADVAATLTNLREISASLAANQGNLQQVLARLDTFLVSATRVSDQLPGTVTRLNDTLARIDAAVDSVDRAGAELAELGRSGQSGLSTLSERTLPAANALLLQMRQLTQQLGTLSAELARDPSILLFGPPRRAPGPGE